MDKGKNKGLKILVAILLVVLVIAAIMEDSPLYYKRLVSLQQSSFSSFSIENGIKIGKDNKDLRDTIENGTNVTFGYNFIPSTGSWDTMYLYDVYRYASSGDCTFCCTLSTIENGVQTLCECKYAERIWNELLSLILDNGELVECTSSYDVNGKVLDTPIEKTVSIGGKTFSPDNIDEIEQYFRQLAINAGANEKDLYLNNRIDDRNVADKSTITDLHGDFFINPIGGLSQEEKQKIEEILWEKYRETGARMYVILDNTNDLEQLEKTANKLLDRATSPAMAFGVTASDSSWTFRYVVDSDHKAIVDDNMKAIADAYISGTTTFGKVENVINKTFEVYELGS